MKPFTVYQDEKSYKELHTEKFFIDPQGEFREFSCHSPLWMGENIHLLLMINIGNVTLKEIGLGHNKDSLKNIHNFL